MQQHSYAAYPLRLLARRYGGAAWRHRWISLATAWLVCIVGWTAAFCIPNRYECGARLYVDADAVLTPLLRGLAIESSPGTQLDMLQRTLLSRPNLDKLIAKTDLALGVAGPKDQDRLAARLATSIKVVSQTHNLFTITYHDSDPRLARDVVQTILDLFIESKAGANRSDMENARSFLQQQIVSYEQQLREAERRRAEFRSRYVDVLPSDANGGVSRLETARGDTRRLQGQLQDAIAGRDMLKREIAATPAVLPAEVLSASGMPIGTTPLAEAERSLRELRLRYTEEHPDVIAARDLVATLRNGGGPMAQGPHAPSRPPAPRALPNPLYEQLKLRFVEAEANVAALTRQVNDAVAERNRLDEIARGSPGLDARAQDMDRDYNILRKNYEELLARRESTRISEAAENEADKIKLQIVDPPQLPHVPVAPNRLLLLAGVLLAGVAAGAAVIVLLVRLDTSFHVVDELRDLGLPVLGGLSCLVAGLPSPRRPRPLAGLLGFGAAALLLGIAFSGLVSRILLAAPA